MTVQPVQENKSSGIMPVVLPTAVGAGAGYFMAPAKYNSLEAILAETNANDMFSKTGLDGDAKTVYDAAKKASEGYKADIAALDGEGFFKAAADGKVPESVDATKVLNKFGVKTSTEAEKIAAKVAENIDKLKKDGKILLSIENNDAGTKLAKEILGEKGTVQEINNALSGLKGTAETITDEALNNAKKVVADAKIGDDFLAAAKEGKVDKAAAEGLAKAKAAATPGLEKFAEQTKSLFGKNIGKGIGWGAAIGLVLGLGYKFFTRNKDAA